MGCMLLSKGLRYTEVWFSLSAFMHVRQCRWHYILQTAITRYIYTSLLKSQCTATVHNGSTNKGCLVTHWWIKKSVWERHFVVCGHSHRNIAGVSALSKYKPAPTSSHHSLTTKPTISTVENLFLAKKTSWWKLTSRCCTPHQTSRKATSRFRLPTSSHLALCIWAPTGSLNKISNYTPIERNFE